MDVQFRSHPAGVRIAAGADQAIHCHQATQRLAKGYKRPELALAAYALYERFRPDIPAGKTGWGAKGDLDLGLIERMAQDKA
jgi:hypothetical protein